MTVETTDAFVRYFGDGVTTEFPFNFRCDDATWMQGWVDRLPQSGSAILNPDQDNDAGGVFVFDLPPPVSSDPEEENVTIFRAVDFKQLTAYAPYTRFPAKDHEEALDKLTMITQQLAYLVVLLQGDASLYVLKAGDVMIGQLETIDPVGDKDATNKGYVDAADAALQASINLKADKSYVDAQDNALSARITSNDNDIDDLQFNKADKSTAIVTNDNATLTITNPTLANDVNVTTRTNISNGLVKLNADGKVPSELLSINGLSLQGYWRAPSGNNPSEENPTEEYTIGDYYIMAVDATMNLIDPADGLIKPIQAFRGDYILFIEPTDSSPSLPTGWLTLPANTQTASNILYDNSSSVFIGGNVQDALDEVGSAALLDAGDVLQTGQDGAVGNISITRTATFVNASDSLLTSTIEAATSATRRVLSLNGKTSTSDGGWMRLYGDDDSVDANEVRIGYGGNNSPVLRVSGAGRLTLNRIIEIENAADSSLISRISAPNAAGRRHLDIFGGTSQLTGGWIQVFGNDDSDEPDEIHLGFGGDLSPNLKIQSSQAVTVRRALIFENSTSSALTSRITASDSASRRLISMFGRDDASNGGWISAYGADDTTYPNQIRMGFGGVTTPSLSVLAGDAVQVNGRLILANPSVQSNTSRVNALDGASRQVLQLSGRSTDNSAIRGGYIGLHGSNDQNPDQIVMQIGNTQGLNVRFDDAPFNSQVALYLNDMGGTLRRSSWLPQRIAISSNTSISNSHINQNLFIDNAVTQITVPSNIGYDGALITLRTSTSGFSLVAGSGVTLTWLQGGSNSTGTRTIASSSVITLHRASATSWMVWGIGIS